MKKYLMVIFLMVFSNLYASKCNSSEFRQILKENIKQQKAWNSGDLKELVSFYADDFMYMSSGKAYATKNSVLKHYADSFGEVNDDGKINMGKLKLDYQYCKNIDNNSQLVILEYTLVSPKGKKSSGKDLMLWQKNKKGEYKITVDFPQ
ncbi:MAG: ketosteroid isomerase-like protein [Francisella sp.]|jgi:ketosteroid isomerase-like protein